MQLLGLLLVAVGLSLASAAPSSQPCSCRAPLACCLVCALQKRCSSALLFQFSLCLQLRRRSCRFFFYCKAASSYSVMQCFLQAFLHYPLRAEWPRSSKKLRRVFTWSSPFRLQLQFRADVAWILFVVRLPKEALAPFVAELQSVSP